MNTWKDRLIEYLQTIDGTMSLEEADKLVLAEWARIKNDYLQKDKVAKIVETTDNHVQAEKSMSMSEVIVLYRDLFYGRQDVYAVRWENEKAGTHGYAPKCKNEWDRNICGKSMRIKGACKKCAYRENQEITDASIKQHLAGNGRNALVMGVYPLLENETCRFLAIDFDKGNWQEEILAAKNVYEEYGIKSYIERSRSGNGGHLWCFSQNL